jgi:protein-tyrosine phosphatase
MDMPSIEGTLNFRAVAPYPAAGGRLRPGSLYRSGAFDGLDRAGVEAMRRIGVTTVFDLRTETEKAKRPSPLVGQAGFRIVAQAHDFRSGDLGAVLADLTSTVRAATDVMIAIYDRLPVQFTDVFRLYIGTVIETDGPVVVHCAAGKDRTGVAVALVLELIGVSRDDIFEDYLKTNAARDRLRQKFMGRNEGIGIAAVAPEVAEPVISADRRYLEAMFSAVERDFGDVRAYATRQLGFSETDLRNLALRLVA